MDHDKYKFRSCSVHIVSGSTIAFRNPGKKVTPSLLPQFYLQERVHGIPSTIVMSGCMGPNLRDEAKKHTWDDHEYFQKGIHTP
eukprot:2834902-Pyramimonas_sp.AAC.1